MFALFFWLLADTVSRISLDLKSWREKYLELDGDGKWMDYEDADQWCVKKISKRADELMDNEDPKILRLIEKMTRVQGVSDIEILGLKPSGRGYVLDEGGSVGLDVLFGGGSRGDFGGGGIRGGSRPKIPR